VTSVRRIIVSVSDLDRSLAVYADALGLERLWSNDEVARLRVGDAELMLHRRTPTPVDFGVAATFGVDDVDEVTSAAVGAGAVVVHGPDDEAWGERQAVLRDPDGHLFCLVTPIERLSESGTA
jgi:catechol 2,3-dioxygenase-like lactoylglutathione lyase family enzyme